MQFDEANLSQKLVFTNLPAERSIKEIKNAPSALLSYISTREFLRTREKCREARAVRMLRALWSYTELGLTNHSACLTLAIL